MKITSLESQLLNQILNSNSGGYEERTSEWSYSEDLDVNMSQARALMTTLAKKGIVEVDTTDADVDGSGTSIYIKREYLKEVEGLFYLISE